MSDDKLMNEALAATAAGAGRPPVVGVNGNGPAEPAQAPAADAHAPERPAVKEPAPEPAQAAQDKPIPGDTTALEARVMQLQADVRRAQRISSMAMLMCALAALVMLAANTPRAVAMIGERLPSPDPLA